MLSPSEYNKLRKACAVLEPGPDYRDVDYLACLFTTVLDFQMKVATYTKALEHFERTMRLRVPDHDGLVAFLAVHEDTDDGNRAAAQELWGNNCWTRLAFLRVLVKYLERHEVRDFDSLRAWASEVCFEADVQGKVRSRHHSIGPAIFKWLQLRLSLPAVKPDVWVLRFVESVIGRWPKELEAADALEQIALDLDVPAFRLDSAIWHLMRD